jgi:hypothetical protein
MTRYHPSFELSPETRVRMVCVSLRPWVRLTLGRQQFPPRYDAHRWSPGPVMTSRKCGTHSPVRTDRVASAMT